MLLMSLNTTLSSFILKQHNVIFAEQQPPLWSQMVINSMGLRVPPVSCTENKAY